jgi:CBS domain-containing protein
MNTVRELLQDKDYEVMSIKSDKSVYDAMQLMVAKKIGALPVLEAGKLIGIITERDYPGKAKRLDRPLQDVLVKETMTSQVVHVGPEDTTEDCLALITEKRVRHLPVMESDQIIGMISIGDLSRASS